MRTYGGDLLEPFQVDHLSHARVRERLAYHLGDEAVQKIIGVHQLPEPAVYALDKKSKKRSKNSKKSKFQ